MNEHQKIDAQQLFAGNLAACVCDCGCPTCAVPEPIPMWTFEVHGRLYATNRFVMIRTDVLDEEFADRVPWWAESVRALEAHRVERIPDWLTATPDGRTLRWFNRHYLEPLEDAGYRVCALRGQTDVHGILSEHGLVGCIMPVAAKAEGDAAEHPDFVQPKAVRS